MRVLVVYGSTRGGTAGLADMVADALRAHGIEAETTAAPVVDDLARYDAVVVGGALYGNRWHQEATDFVDRFRPELRALPVWFFSSGPLDESARAGDLAPIPHVRELARALDIRGHMTFGGVLERKPSGFLGSLLAYGPVGDYRDPHQVAGWAEWIVRGLDEPRTVVDLDEPYAGEPVRTTADPTDGGGDGALAKVRRLLTVDDDTEEDAGLDVLL
jgi:menaquinone-dependent protoporphyrinogen oxidase